MKWPESVTLVRHDESAYNRLKPLKEEDPLYKSFKKSFNKNKYSDESRKLAQEVWDKYRLKFGDHDTPLAHDAGHQAESMATKLKGLIDLPDVIFVSPYERTYATLDKMKLGWPELSDVKTVEEERIREQDHGKSLIYNDWRVFNVFNEGQYELRQAQGSYWYRYLQGENVPDVKLRLHSWQNTLTRDYSNKKILAVTHHLTILAFRSNLERLNAEEFIRLDHEEKPINAGVTIYRGEPEHGTDGKLVLQEYNTKLY